MTELELNFDDIAPIEIKVTIQNEKYVLEEATGQVATKYLNARLGKIKFNDGKASSLQGIADIEPFLVSMCLFKLDFGATGEVIKKTPVSVTTIQSWPFRIQDQLYKEAKRISQLDKIETPYNELIEEAFNNPEAPATSEAILGWIDSLEDEKFDPIKKLFENSGNSSKN